MSEATRGATSTLSGIFPGPGSTPTTTSGSATPTTIGPGASWPTRGRPWTHPAPAPRPRTSRWPARSCSSPRGRTGSGGTATTTRRSTTSSSTTSSAGTSATSTGASTSRCPRSCTSPTSPPNRRRTLTHAPSGLLHPTIDGEVTSYFEWIGAGELEVSEAAGSMHQVAPIPRRQVTAIQFGFDDSTLYVRVDLTRRAQDMLADKGEVRLSFFEPAGHRVVLSRGADGTEAQVLERRAPSEWAPKAGRLGPWGRRADRRAGGPHRRARRTARPAVAVLDRAVPGRPGARTVPATQPPRDSDSRPRLRGQDCSLALRVRRRAVAGAPTPS